MKREKPFARRSVSFDKATFDQVELYAFAETRSFDTMARILITEALQRRMADSSSGSLSQPGSQITLDGV